MKTFFYIIVVAYNAGEALLKTYESICKQHYKNMLVLVQDGASTDGSIASLRRKIAAISEAKESARRNEGPQVFLPRTAIISKKDKGIYDAMNKAVDRAVADRNRRFGKKAPARYEERGSLSLPGKGMPDCYCIFMNCGDLFYGDDVLRTADEHIREWKKKKSLSATGQEDKHLPGIFYGDTFERTTKQIVSAARVLDDFACYRGLPCHQSCIYDLRFMEREKYDLSFRVRADYEHFLRLKYKCHADTKYLQMTIADYEGGGFSETPENKKCSEKERRDIVDMYLPRKSVLRFDLYRVLSLQPLREKLANNERTAPLYHKIRTRLMGHKKCSTKKK